MILGVGLDAVALERIAQITEKNAQRFQKHLLSPEEHLAFEHASDPILFLAHRFTVKEAFAKALGSGFRGDLTLPSLTLAETPLRLTCNAPARNFCLNILEARTPEWPNIHISITNTDTQCQAIVILEVSDDNV